MVQTNSVNTTFTDEMLDSLSREERETFLEYLYSIEWVKNLISPNRPYAKDLKRWKNPNEEDPKKRVMDPKGRIRIDFQNPHILEDVDYFRQAALTFEKYGKYTLLMPSKNPYSEYVKFWNREIERCWYGMTRESDGEWITGYHYFYLNYGVIRKNITEEGSKRASRANDSFPDFYDGDYWFFHYLDRARDNGAHTCTLKKRGSGYSFKGAAKLARNFLLGEDEASSEGAASFAIANEKEYLTKDGVLNKFVAMLDFLGTHTPFPRRKELKDSWNLMHWIMGYKDPETGLEKGTKNEVMGVTLKNDPERARGKRGVLIEWEEFGKFSNALKAWTIGRPSVEAAGGNFAFGLMNAYGTGGTEGAAFEGLRELFYKPQGHNVFALDNVFDKNAKQGATCAFFHASYLNAEARMDKNGNSDVTRSLLEIIQDRIQIKYNSSDASTLVQAMAENPITPQEAIMKVGGNIFPTVDIRDYLEECRINESAFTQDHLVGELIMKSEVEVEFQQNFNLKPIRKYQPDVGNTVGALEVYKMPEKSNGVVPSYRYILGVDPIDNDYIELGSLASVFVFDLWTDQIVAEYTGRPMLAEDFYEIVRRMCIFYNGQANYESNIKGLFGYFNNKNCLYLLADTPKYLRDSEDIRFNLTGSRAKGTRGVQAVNAEGIRLQKSWMLQKYQKNETESIMLRTIRSLGYLEELYEWNSDGNFDRVSAMGMVMILRKERLKITNKTTEEEDVYVEMDEFIKANYDDRGIEEIDFKNVSLFKENRYENKIS